MIVAKHVAVGVYRSNGYTLARIRSKVNRKQTYWKVLETDTVAPRLKDLMLLVACWSKGITITPAGKRKPKPEATGNLFEIDLNQTKLTL